MVESPAETIRKRTNGSCGSGNKDSRCGSWRNDSKLLNYESDFRRNSAFRLRGYNKNFINNGKLNITCAVDNYMPILLTLIVFSNGTNLEKKIVPLFRLSCSAFLPLILFLSGGGRVLDLRS